MSGPRRERAEQRKTLVSAVPICVVFGYKFQHLAVFGAEIAVDKRQKRTGVREISIMEMMVVESVAVIACVIADKRAPTVIARKKIRLLTGSICEPIFHHFTQPRTALFEQFIFSQFFSECHIQCHLDKSFSSPIGIGTETAFGGIVSNHLLHTFPVVRIGKVCHLLRRCKPWQNATEMIRSRERVACCHFHFPTWCGIGIFRKLYVVLGIFVMMRYESLQDIPF